MALLLTEQQEVNMRHLPCDDSQSMRDLITRLLILWSKHFHVHRISTAHTLILASSVHL